MSDCNKNIAEPAEREVLHMYLLPMHSGMSFLMMCSCELWYRCQIPFGLWIPQ